MAIPGIHVAVHTEEQLLSAGAWMDFSQYVTTLVLAGRMDEARVLWGSVFEVVHLGVDPAMPVLQDPRLPPLRRIPCCVKPCRRCESALGGFKFPFVGLWTRRAVFAQVGASAAETWDAFLRWPDEKLDLVAVQAAASGLSVPDFIPSHMERVLVRLALGRDGISLGLLYERWRTWQNGEAVWREPAFFMASEGTPSVVAGRFMRTILGAVEAAVDYIPEVCLVCLCPCFSTCPGCGAQWCDECRGFLSFCAMCGSSDEEIAEGDLDFM